jgi:uncharacterized protein DUF1501
MNAAHPTPITRRRLLQAGTLALFSGAAPAHAAGAPAGAGRARACILVYLLGGPSHIDMWDLKPDAPAEVRGPFRPIRTSAPGVEISEHLPRIARQAHRLAIVRSVTYPNGDHPFMTYHTLTGRVSPEPLGANTVLPPSRRDDPHLGSVVARFKHRRPDVPGYVAIPEVRVRMQPVPIAGGGRAGFLGPQYDPLCINEDPRERVEGLDLPEMVSAARFDRRRSLLATLDGTPAEGAQGEYQAFRDRGTGLVRAAGADGLFSLDREPEPLRERYGKHRFGQSLLLARRLVERGVSFAAVHFNHMSKCDGWDTHANNFECLKGELLPLLDQGLSALLQDLADRGLLDETLVVVMGEFGRTPKINASAGRDHWGECASVVLAGGGVRGGTVVGASDGTGAYPVEQPVGPPDIVATIYHALDLRPEARMYDSLLQRPMTLCDGVPLRQLF